MTEKYRKKIAKGIYRSTDGIPNEFAELISNVIFEAISKGLFCHVFMTSSINLIGNPWRNSEVNLWKNHPQTAAVTKMEISDSTTYCRLESW